MGDLESAEEAFRQADEMGEDPQPGRAMLLLRRGQDRRRRELPPTEPRGHRVEQAEPGTAPAVAGRDRVRSRGASDGARGGAKSWTRSRRISGPNRSAPRRTGRTDSRTSPPARPPAPFDRSARPDSAGARSTHRTRPPARARCSPRRTSPTAIGKPRSWSSRPRGRRSSDSAPIPTNGGPPNGWRPCAGRRTSRPWRGGPSCSPTSSARPRCWKRSATRHGTTSGVGTTIPCATRSPRTVARRWTTPVTGSSSRSATQHRPCPAPGRSSDGSPSTGGTMGSRPRSGSGSTLPKRRAPVRITRGWVCTWPRASRAVAGAGEIIASATSVDGLQDLELTDRRSVTLKGIAEPVEIVSIGWR